MELKAHFSQIHKAIIQHLEPAQTEIVAAIAWFTDRDIFEVLCKKARSGVKVTVVLIGDDINQGPGGLNFQRLINLGGQVIFLPSGSREVPTMHHKFCVIDSTTVITGSYNWSQKARSNDENITIVTDAKEYAGSYLSTFDSLIARGGHGTIVVADVDTARRRLEMIRNLVLLGEQDDAAIHVRKLRPDAEALHLSAIIAALDQGEYTIALEAIDAYLRKVTSLVVAGLTDIPALRFQLQTLELRLESLSDEKAELERRLITFNRRHDDALGDLIQRILKARAELAQLHVAEQKSDKKKDEAQVIADEAEETYKNYARQHEELQRSEPPPKLDVETERELKSFYRKACNLCHPDKVPEQMKEAAHRLFVDLQVAYKGNDLTRVREIYQALAAGGLPGTRASTLNEAESLKSAISEMEYAIAKLVFELKALQESDGMKLMDTAGATEADWQLFLKKQQKLLGDELAKIMSEITAVKTAQ